MEADSNRQTYPHPRHPPFVVSLNRLSFGSWADLKIEGDYDITLTFPERAAGRWTGRFCQVRQTPSQPWKSSSA